MPKISDNAIRICKRCGAEYHPKSSRQQCCNAPIEVPCAICGKMMKQICTFADQSKTCSKECADALIKRNREKTACSIVKICKYCGKEFTPKFIREEYCPGPHYATCEVCGKNFELKDVKRTDLPKTCSKECFKLLQSMNVNARDKAAVTAKHQATMLSRYGVKNAMELDSSKEKIKATNLMKYGKEWYTQTPEYKDKVEATDKAKYGEIHHLKSKDVIQKREATVLEKYGVKNVFQADEIKLKAKQTLQDKYGVSNVSQSPQIRDKVMHTNLMKYGVSHAMKLDAFKNKAQATTQRRYGRRAYTQQHIVNIDNWYAFMRDPKEYIESHFDEYPTIKLLSEHLGVDVTTVCQYLSKNDAYDHVSRVKSVMEKEIVEFIYSLDPNIEIIQNTRSVIAPLELDTYLPKYHLAIECNPTVTHNSSFIDPWGGEPKPYKYHQIKTEACNEAGIFLFHIFGYEWTWDKSIILSMLANLLKHNDYKIYARNCTVAEISASVARKFLNDNHRQHYTNASIRLGLIYEGELVSLMTFGKIRNTIGSGSEDLSNCWELSRFCSRKYTAVVGGASKLFKYFVQNYQPTQIRSFSDCAHVKGALYPTLGFKDIRHADATYNWVDLHTDKGYHRMSGRKSNLQNFLKDDSIDLSQTEKQIMEAHGFAQVFDSGTITWEWRNNQ